MEWNAVLPDCVSLVNGGVYPERMRQSQASRRIATPSVLARIDSWLRVTIEAGVLLLVCLSPWAFGCIEPEFEAILYWGLAILIVLWGARTLLEQRLRWAH